MKIKIAPKPNLTILIFCCRGFSFWPAKQVGEKVGKLWVKFHWARSYLKAMRRAGAQGEGKGEVRAEKGGGVVVSQGREGQT